MYEHFAVVQDERDSDHHQGRLTEDGDEPRHPMHAVTQTHDLHHFLQAHFLLVDDTLREHGEGIDPRDGQTERKGVLDHLKKTKRTRDGEDRRRMEDNELVVAVARIGHFLIEESRFDHRSAGLRVDDCAIDHFLNIVSTSNGRLPARICVPEPS